MPAEPKEPKIEWRAAQPYAAIRRPVTMRTIPEIADRIPEVFAWLAARGIEPAGAPFLRYHVIDMERHMDIEAGVPVAAPIDIDGAGDEDGDVISGVLPEGRYVTVTHIGHFDKLIDVTAALLDWAARAGLAWDMTETGDVQEWACRLEIYKTDPRTEPDMSTWETELAFRLADG